MFTFAGSAVLILMFGKPELQFCLCSYFRTAVTAPDVLLLMLIRFLLKMEISICS